MDKTAFKITSLRDDDSREYWAKKTYIERLEAMELMRQSVFGYDPATERLQRTLRITNLKED